MASSIHCLYKEIAPPASIDHAVSARFTAENQVNLITVCGRQLCIYLVVQEESIQPVQQEQELDDDMDQDLGLPRLQPMTINQHQPPKTAKMELMYTFTLQGIVSSIGVVRTCTSVGLDSLLLTFPDAKMSLIEFNEATHSLVTVSMHNYEKSDVKVGIDRKEPMVAVDPQNRCAAMWFHNDRLAFLPFKQDSGMNVDGETQSKVPFLPSFVVGFTDMDPDIRNVIDITFLHGYFEPAIAILFESNQTISGRVGLKKDSVSLIVLSLDFLQRKFPVLYRIDKLPYNCTHIQAVPPPVSGVLIFSHNAVIHTDQTHAPGMACVVNGYFDLETELKAQWHAELPPELIPSLPPRPKSVYLPDRITDYKSLGISLDACHSIILNPDTVLLVLRNGQVYLLDLIGDEAAGRGWKRRKGGVIRFELKFLGIVMCPPTSLVLLHQEGSAFASSNPISDSPFDLGGVCRGSTGAKLRFGYCFAASRVSDSLLIQFTEVEGGSETSHQSLSMETNLMDDMDDLDADLYGDSEDKTQASNSNTHSFLFGICDSLFTTGARKDFAISAPAPLSNDMPLYDTNQLEIVSCGGYGAFGSLIIQSKSIRSKILSSFDLPGVEALFTVKCSNLRKAQGIYDIEEFHKFIVLSKEDSTLVIKAGEELEEVAHSGFFTGGPTIAVGTIDTESLIVQIHPHGILILDSDGSQVTSKVLGRVEVKIVSAYISDPYILLIMSSGELRLMNLDLLSKELITVAKTKNFKPSSAYLFCDESFSKLAPFNKEIHISHKPKLSVPLPKPVTQDNQTKDTEMEEEKDEDWDDLYGDDEASDEKMEEVEPEPQLDLPMQEESIPTELNVSQAVNDNIKRHWCFLTDEDGNFRILALPDFKECFSSPRLDLLPQTVSDLSVDIEKTKDDQSEKMVIEEMIVTALGRNDDRKILYMMFRTKHMDLVIYKAYTYLDEETRNEESSQDRLGIRFVRVPHDHIARDSFLVSEMSLGSASNKKTPPFKKCLFRPFDYVGSSDGMLYSGVALIGNNPCVMMVASQSNSAVQNFQVIDSEISSKHIYPPSIASGRNIIRVHPLSIDGPLLAFEPFHNPNANHGFLSMNAKHTLRICQLASQFNYDHPLPSCRAPLSRSADKLGYHYVSETYTLATSTRVPFEIEKAQYSAAVAAGVIKEGDDLPESERKISGIADSLPIEPGMYLPDMGQYQLELVSPVTWETVDVIQLEHAEQVLCLEIVEIASNETTSGRKLLVAVGTGFFRSEDLACRGRLLLYDIIDVVPEPNNPQTNHKFKKVFVNEEKSPVTALCAVNGYLLAAIGTKIILHELSEGELTGLAFLDVNLYTCSLSAVKNLILISDICKSVCFAVFQEEPPKIIQLGKDYYPIQVHSSEFLIDESSLGMMTTDAQKNLHLMRYDPFNVMSQGGSRLSHKGEIHVGYATIKPVRFRLFSGSRRKESDQSKSEQRFGNMIATVDGGFAVLMPVSEKLYRRLYALYSRMVTSISHVAGLNPRGFRQVQARIRPIMLTGNFSGPPGPKGILDGDLLSLYNSLSLMQRKELAKAIGSTDERILDNLLEILSRIDYF